MAKCDCVIFTGPSLSWSEVTGLDRRLRCCPPAVRGDISRVVEGDVRIIGLIDGVFYNRAAVSHREIVDAMKAGVTVVGGSSMGALRAAELDGFGMIGIGKIYRCFKEGLIEADDEVAVAYNPVTFEPVSDPLVNIRVALHSLLDASIVDADTSNALLNLAQSFFYMERSVPTLLKTAEARGLITEDERDHIFAFLTNLDYDLKKQDAKLVVREVGRLATEKLQTAVADEFASELMRLFAECTGTTIAILGIGNELKRDDAVGLAVVERLRLSVDDPSIVLVNCQNVPENFTGYVKRVKPDCVVFIDAADFGALPGDARVFELSDLKASDITTHRASLTVLGEYLRSEIQARIFVIGIQPAECGFGSGLSSVVHNASVAVADSIRTAISFRSAKKDE